MAIAHIKKGEARYLKSGGQWIYDNEIESFEGDFKDGDILEVQDFDGYPLGKGFVNRISKITIRMMTRKADQVIDDEFIKMRVKNAWEYRKAVMNKADLNCARVIFGEADFLPGLVVDKYSDVLVVESLALGIERFKQLIIDSLKEYMTADGFNVRGVYERSDAKVRKKEGLEPSKGFIGSEFDTNVEIIENGVCYIVDVVNGQKTGFFLDQKYNRLAMQRIIAGLSGGEGEIGALRNGMNPVKVLDCFTHMGTFALNCGLAGATDVTGLDISEFAVEQATNNAKLNGISDRVKFRAANVLDELPKLYEKGELYDVVILDPPAFTKSREATKNAIKGYREINMKGLKLVKDGGFLATCSCSHFMTEDLFKKTIYEAAKSSHKRLRQVEFRTQSVDHPILWANDASYYLKFLIFQVVDEK